MESLTKHYTQRKFETEAQLQSANRTIHWIGTVRLILVISCVVISWYFWGQWSLLLAITVPLIIALGYFIQQHSRLFKKKSYLERASAICGNELNALEYNFNAFDGAEERLNPAHPFTFDLDIFGYKSIFQYINRTCSQFGKTILADWFEQPLNHKAEIIRRQSAIKELSEKETWMHHFEVTGKEHPIEVSAPEQLKTFTSCPALFSPKSSWKMFTYIIPICWLLYFIGLGLGWISLQTLPLVIIAGIAVGESQFKKINQLQHTTGKEVLFFSGYSNAIRLIETENFESELLNELQSTFSQNGTKTSEVIRKLSRLLYDLELRENILGRIVLNTLFLWDIRKALQIEQWKKQHGQHLISWMNTLGTFDALISPGRFSFNHPDYMFPEIVDNYFQMEGKALGHPLLHRDICVKNDINIESQPYFMIVTGANMAGKSTYLRTIGVNFLLSCIGSPVCAQSLRIYPATLVTSLRTSDSLSEQESYFFAELKRLKMMIDQLNTGKKLFIILDEILKGTNSVDKQKGSLALIQQFVSLKTCGIIATHDILLGELENAFPENIKNYRFEADIQDDELRFSYKMQTGIAQNMNACFLMKKMGITI